MLAVEKEVEEAEGPKAAVYAKEKRMRNGFVSLVRHLEASRMSSYWVANTHF